MPPWTGAGGKPGLIGRSELCSRMAAAKASRAGLAPTQPASAGLACHQHADGFQAQGGLVEHRQALFALAAQGVDLAVAHAGVDRAQGDQARHIERVAEAKRRLIAELDEELARLVALQAVNPSVRDSEINALREQREQSLAMFDKAALRLEAIRVLVAG